MRYRPTRRHLVIAGIVLATLAVLTVVGLWVIYPRVGKWMVEDKVVPKLEAKLGRDITVGGIDITHGHAVLRDVAVHGPDDGDAPLVTIARIDVDFDFWASLTGDAKVGAVVIDGVSVRARRGPDGVDNFRDILERLGVSGDDKGDGKPRTGMGSLRPTRIELRAGEATFTDEAGGVTVTVAAMDGGWARGQPTTLHLHDARAVTSFGASASAAEITALDHPVAGRGLEVGGGELALWKGLSLTGIVGSVAPEAADPTRFAVAFEGGYGGVDGRLWTASGWIQPSTFQGALDLDAERFTLDRLRPILERSAVVDYESASVDARLHVELTGAAATFAGGFHLQDFTIDHPMLAEKPVHALEVGGEIEGGFDRASRVLTLARADLSARGLPFHLEGWLALPHGLEAAGTRRARAAFDVRLVIPPKPCQEVLEAIPTELVPYLEGFQLTGTFDTDLRIAVDYNQDLEKTVLAGHVGLFKCRGKKGPEDVRRLAKQFEHYVEVERGEWVSFIVGPDNPDFVPITDVSKYLPLSLMTTEDSSFYRHRGFITKEFRSALIKNLEAGYFKYGASSITMQLVKNALLYREKTLSRKLQELFLTWYIETFLEKDRILEIYVNIIEYGPGIYGIGPAAMHYFGKHPRDLNPVETAFFSSILPSPKARYDQYCKGTLRKWTESKIQRILALMLKRGRLTQEEYDLAIVTPLTFVKDGTESVDACMARRKRALKNARPTNPLKK